jgi:AcrR family transcriptional regulator
MSYIERKIRDREAVKNSILEAAKRIAIKEGWHSVTIRKIADEIEYTPPIVYEHFENKEDLIKELMLSGFRMLSDGFKKSAQGETDPKELLRLLSVNHWEFALKNKELYKLMFSIERPSPNSEMLANINEIKSIFAKVANNNEKLGREIMFNWVCLVNGTISTIMHFMPPDIIDRDPKELFENSIDRFIRSL